MADDEILFKKYDLENSPASQYFFKNPNVLSCAIRLGKNITPTVPESHRKALYVKAQPRFIDVKENILVWSWPDNLHTYHWACIASTTGHIYRKEIYLKWFHEFGRHNFFQIEAKVPNHLSRELFGLPLWFDKLLYLADIIQMRYLHKFFDVDGQDVLTQIFYKFLYSVGIFHKKGIPLLMASPIESVTTCLDINTNQEWRKIESDYNKQIGQYMDHLESNEFLNEKYLGGEIISSGFINNSIIDEPNTCKQSDEKMEALNYTIY